MYVGSGSLVSSSLLLLPAFHSVYRHTDNYSSDQDSRAPPLSLRCSRALSLCNIELGEPAGTGTIDMVGI